MNTKELLNAEIESVSKRMKEMEIGSEEYAETAKTWAMLMDRMIEIENHENEREDRSIQHKISIGGIVLPALITIWGTFKSLKFEETGTITTIIGRGFINKLLPKK